MQESEDKHVDLETLPWCLILWIDLYCLQRKKLRCVILCEDFWIMYQEFHATMDTAQFMHSKSCELLALLLASPAEHGPAALGSRGGRGAELE